jgi:hypothetical protein
MVYDWVYGTIMFLVDVFRVSCWFQAVTEGNSWDIQFNEWEQKEHVQDTIMFYRKNNNIISHPGAL